MEYRLTLVPQAALDLKKPLQTRDGKPVRLLCTNANTKGDWPLVGLVTNSMTGLEYVFQWHKDGSLYPDTAFHSDLINVPVKKVTKYIVMFTNQRTGKPKMSTGLFDSEEQARGVLKGRGILQIIPVIIEE